MVLLILEDPCIIDFAYIREPPASIIDFAYITEPLACIENGVLMHGCGKTPLLIFESNRMSIHKTVFQHIMKTLKLTHIYISSVSTTEILIAEI